MPADHTDTDREELEAIEERVKDKLREKHGREPLAAEVVAGMAWDGPSKL